MHLVYDDYVCKRLILEKPKMDETGPPEARPEPNRFETKRMFPAIVWRWSWRKRHGRHWRNGTTRSTTCTEPFRNETKRMFPAIVWRGPRNMVQRMTKNRKTKRPKIPPNDLPVNRPRKIRTPMEQINFPGNLGFRPRDWSHWICLEILCWLEVFMCAEHRYGPGSGRNRFWDTPSPKKF